MKVGDNAALNQAHYERNTMYIAIIYVKHLNLSM